MLFMIFRIIGWFKKKEKRKRATVRLGHGFWPSPQHSQPSLGPNPRSTTTGPSEKNKK
jgi:hypothetical protein